MIKYDFLLKKSFFRVVTYQRVFKKFYWKSNDVRSAFYNFFKENNHQYVPPSSVIPLGDSSLTYINAGMNQFKPIFLGLEEACYQRAYNSQKCIRVGGKHNDLSVVGKDSFHHTFFEMLGNWSFGDYFKDEACIFAWRLLTEIYKISPRRLFVTYFEGNDELKLLPDLETKEIWLKIGVPENHILPFGCKENFWEMGSAGPCGPCTEIHYSHDPDNFDAKYVNKGSENLIELWNIVFIQYERIKDGSIKTLSNFYVDTGMGLERITAVLNGKISNYDTDLFQCLFQKLHELSNKPAYSGNFGENELDTAYRTLADHSRMITVSLCDNMLPNDCNSLKNIIRKCLNIGHSQFGFKKNYDWLEHLFDCNVKILEESHLSMKTNSSYAKDILKYHVKLIYEIEADVKWTWENMTEKFPGLENISNVDTYNLGQSILRNFNKFKTLQHSGDYLSPIDGAHFIKENDLDEDSFKKIMETLQISYDFDKIMLAANISEDTVKEINSNMEYSAELSKKYKHYNTLNHLMLAALNISTKVYQRSVNQTDAAIKLDVLSFHKVTPEQLVEAEDIIRQWIKTGAKVSRRLIPLRDAIAIDNCIVDFRKKYPLKVWVVSIENTSNSTIYQLNTTMITDLPYLTNISELDDFAFSKIKYKKYGITSVYGIYGETTKTLHANLPPIRAIIDEWKETVTDAIDRNLRLRGRWTTWKIWRQELELKNISGAHINQINSEINFHLQKVEAIVCPPPNFEKIIEEGKNIINLHNGDGIYEHINIDIRGKISNLIPMFEGDEKFAIVFSCKGWGKMGVIVYVPKNRNVSLQKMFEEIQLLYGKGRVDLKLKNHNIGCLSLKFKLTDLEKIPNILNICRSHIEKTNTS